MGKLMILAFPDGQRITLVIGSNLPPGSSGQHVGCNYLWFKIESGEWEQSSFRSLHRAVDAVLCSECPDDYRELERDASGTD